MMLVATVVATSLAGGGGSHRGCCTLGLPWVWVPKGNLGDWARQRTAEAAVNCTLPKHPMPQTCPCLALLCCYPEPEEAQQRP